MGTKKLTMCLFNKEETKRVAKSLGFDLRKTKCCICEKRIRDGEIGHFVHYKKKKAVLCTKINCFSVWRIEEHLVN